MFSDWQRLKERYLESDDLAPFGEALDVKIELKSVVSRLRSAPIPASSRDEDEENAEIWMHPGHEEKIQEAKTSNFVKSVRHEFERSMREEKREMLKENMNFEPIQLRRRSKRASRSQQTPREDIRKPHYKNAAKVRRFMARWELKRIRQSLLMFRDNTDRQRALREEKLNVFGRRRLLKNHFNRFKFFTRSNRKIRRFRKRVVTKRMWLKWRDFSLDIHAMKLQEKMEHAALEQEKLAVEQAKVFFRFQFLRTTFTNWSLHSRMCHDERAELARMQERRLKAKKFLEIVREGGGEIFETNEEKREEKSEPQEMATTRKVKKPKALQDMDLRAERRRQRRHEMERMRLELQLMRLEEDAQRKMETALQRGQERLQKLEKERIEEEERQKYALHRREQLKLARLHRKRALLWYKGLKPWVKLVRMKRVLERQAVEHFRLRLKAFVFWILANLKERHQLEQKRKEAAIQTAATRFRRQSLLTLGWIGFRVRHRQIVACSRSIKSKRQLRLLTTQWKTWRKRLADRNALLLAFKVRCERRRLARAFKNWGASIEIFQEEKQRLVLKSQVWSKVRTWLEDEKL